MSDEERLARRAGRPQPDDLDLLKAWAVRADLEGAKAQAGNRVYGACIGLFEALERAGKVRGNGHHMAQAAVEAIVRLLEPRWVSQIPWPNAGLDLLLPGRYYRVRVVQDVDITFEGDLRPLLVEADVRGIVIEHVPGDAPAEPVCRVVVAHGVAPIPARLLAAVDEPLTDLEQRTCAAAELAREAQQAGLDHGHGHVYLTGGASGHPGVGGIVTLQGGSPMATDSGRGAPSGGFAGAGASFRPATDDTEPAR